jgi:hypothetical protein
MLRLFLQRNEVFSALRSGTLIPTPNNLLRINTYLLLENQSNDFLISISTTDVALELQVGLNNSIEAFHRSPARE